MKKTGKVKKGGKRTSDLILIVAFAIGLSLLLYPTVSNWWNSRVQTRAVQNYDSVVGNLEDDTYQEIWNRAVAYNTAIAQKGIHFRDTEEGHDEYESQLNVSNNGMMGYIEIPKIEVKLPIYHGTEESVLQVAVGHIEGSSLPVGGESTHCVISGHRGLPSAKLFTNLDKMEEGDYFTLHILNETLTYEVDQIRIVEPDDLDELQIVEGEDLCTLVTCTPYGINTHRLLVRGHRIANISEVNVDSDAFVIDPMLVAPVVAAPILLVLLILLLWKTRGKRRNKKRRVRRNGKNSQNRRKVRNENRR